MENRLKKMGLIRTIRLPDIKTNSNEKSKQPDQIQHLMNISKKVQEASGFKW